MKRVMYLFFALIAFEGITSAAVKAKIGELYYTLFDNKTATVSYERWRDVTNYSELIGDIVIPPKVTYNNISYSVQAIGEYAFYGCQGITSISIPRALHTIREGAFSFCCNFKAFHLDANNPFFSSIDGVLFNKSKTRIIIYPSGKRGAYAIPSSVKYIGKKAFCGNGCTGLTNLTIPSSVIVIEESALNFPKNFISIHVASNNPNYSSLDGVLFNKDKTILIKYPEGKKGAYSVPNSVKTIGKSSFCGSQDLPSVNIGDNVTIIEQSAFASCYNLNTVTIGHNVRNIGKNAFFACFNLSSLTILSNSVSFAETVFNNTQRVTIYTDCVTSIPDVPSYRVKRLSQTPDVPIQPQVKTSAVCNGYVDLGLPSGTLWKEKNEEYTDMPGEKAYYHMINLKFNGGDVPTLEQWEELQRYCTWKWNGNGCVVRGKNGNSIVLPAAGYFNNINSYLVFGETPEAEGVFGFYWSNTKSPIRIKGEVAFYTFSFFEQNGSIEYGSLPQPISICYSIRLVRKK